MLPSGIEFEAERALRLVLAQRLQRDNPSTLPVFGSSSPTNWLPKSEYQAWPSASTITSWGSASLRGRSYSVMITLVARPFGRGSA